MELTSELKNRVEEFIYNLICDNVDIPSYIDIDNIDLNDPFQSMYDMIDEGTGFYIDIISYGNAMKYLQVRDPSLRKSLRLAQSFGYKLDNLSSEILASLIASEYANREFCELQDEIESFFEVIVQELKEEE